MGRLWGIAKGVSRHEGWIELDVDVTSPRPSEGFG